MYLHSSTPRRPSDLLKDTLLELPFDLLSLIVGTGIAVESHQGTEVEFGRLQQLDLADLDLEKGDALATRQKRIKQRKNI